MTTNGTLKSVQMRVAADPYAFAAKGAFWLSGVVAAGTLAAAVATLKPAPIERAEPVLAAEASAERWTPDAATADEQEPEPPVRITNPFDASEVFEFPPGTTLAEARELMTEMLMERARERYARIQRRS